jgi:hypothetical protein
MLKPAMLAFALAVVCSAGPAAAFCVSNEGSTPISIQAGGPPMPIYVKPNLMPGQRDCFEPRKPEGITVEIYDSANRRLRCRHSVPAKAATITVGQTCKVKLD